jgi:hypothetical protein
MVQAPVAAIIGLQPALAVAAVSSVAGAKAMAAAASRVGIVRIFMVFLISCFLSSASSGRSRGDPRPRWRCLKLSATWALACTFFRAFR